jgi:ribosomal protein L11 methyltransferase
VPHLQLILDLGAREPAPWEDALFELGAVSVTLEDAADDPVLEPAPGATPLWPTVVVKALFDAGADATAIADALARRLPGGPAPRYETVADQAWERVWLEDFRPMRFGRRLWVCPGGLPAGAPDAVRIELDPGLAFGTGTHPTTALCLEWLDGHELSGRDVVDYGCGSGILAIAAARLGAPRVRAVDIDPQALIATRDNAGRNGCAAQLACGLPADLLPASRRQTFDVLVANILSGPLVRLAPELRRFAGPATRVALSGILADQATEVIAAFRPWVHLAVTGQQGGWVLLAGGLPPT